jgi:hypothetical protein
VTSSFVRCHNKSCNQEIYVEYPRCPYCGTDQFSPASLSMSINQVFNDDERDRDDITWQVPTGSVVWPLWQVGRGTDPITTEWFSWEDISQQSAIIQLGTSTLTKRDAYVHDADVHRFRPFASMFVQGNDGWVDLTTAKRLMERAGLIFRRALKYVHEDLYVVQFTDAIHDGRGWVVGYILAAEDLIAADVSGDDEIEIELPQSLLTWN